MFYLVLGEFFFHRFKNDNPRKPKLTRWCACMHACTHTYTFYSWTGQKSRGMHVHVITVMWVKVRMCRNECGWVCWRGEIFFVRLYSSCVRPCTCVTRCALVVAVILKCSTFLAVISEYSTVSVIFPRTSLLCSLYWPWDPLSSSESLLSRSRSRNR